MQAPFVFICRLRIGQIVFAASAELLLDLALIPALKAQEDDSDEQDAGTSAEDKEQRLVRVPADISGIGTLYLFVDLHNIAYDVAVFHGLDFDDLVAGDGIGSLRLFLLFLRLLFFFLFLLLLFGRWFHFGFEPVVETKLCILALIRVGYNEKAFIDAYRKCLPHVCLLIPANQAFRRLHPRFACIHINVHFELPRYMQMQLLRIILVKHRLIERHFVVARIVLASRILPGGTLETHLV